MKKLSTWQKENSADIAAKVLLFLLSPFFSFIYSLRRMNTKSSYVMFFLFALIYGFCFTVIADNTGLEESSDASRWRYRFEYINLYSSNEYLQYVATYFMFATDEVRDLYFLTVTFIVHQFSDNYHFFFFVLSVVFSFFQLKALRFLTGSPQFNNNVVCLLIATLFTANIISHIGGFRFWTAAWICVYSLFEYYVNKRRWFLAVLICLPLIHRGFFFMYPIMAVTLLYKWKSFWNVAYYASFALSGVSIYIIQDATPYLPSFLVNMVEAYSQGEISEGYSFTKLFLTSLQQVYVNVLFIVIMLNRPKELPKGVERLYQFTLVFFAVVNFVMPVPSLGGRFVILCYSLIAYLWLNIMGSTRYSQLIYLMPIFMIRTIYTSLNSFTHFQEPWFYITNPITLIIEHL
jgi:hypothetical protein